MIDEQALQARFDALDPHLDERQRRLFAASEAKAAGWGGIVAVARITGRAPSTIGVGCMIWPKRPASMAAAATGHACACGSAS